MSDQLNPQNSPRPGRHRLDDDFDDIDEASQYRDYSGDYPGAASGAAAGYSASTDDATRAEQDLRDDAAAAEPRNWRRGAAAGAAATAANSESAPAAAGQPAEPNDIDDFDNDNNDVGDGAGDGRYMRILAIVLLIVGVCLVAYGIYALTTRDDDPDNAAKDATSASAPAEPGKADDAAGGDDAAKAGSPETKPADGEDGEVPPPPPSNEPGKPVAPAPQPGQADEDNAAPEINRKAVKVSVLNNSQVVGLADDLSKQITGQGWAAGETGNAPEEKMGVWEKTTVYFDPNNAKEKAAAEQIAHDNGWVTAPRDDKLHDAPAGVVIVATDPAQ
ncbi:MAG: LytR C-terminal domain-containing protein [Corynebacterium sp.]|uniref:LytR C-terminal domain-containing protein n=1 Tax=Corynebacterium sp. TaxID=1720 RepID=UPI0026DD34BF|nr:LytR C-terminal domain-containing protein [Corynebacterium sp.]MDO5029812.1 LytR C-terminal domain-containing protein [Corynebacterium sp.]